MNEVMTPKEFAKEMRKCKREAYDEEVWHIYADVLMCELLTALGYEEGVKVFEEMPKWYS